jgi:hypothetical protein
MNANTMPSWIKAAAGGSRALRARSSRPMTTAINSRMSSKRETRFTADRAVAFHCRAWGVKPTASLRPTCCCALASSGLSAGIAAAPLDPATNSRCRISSAQLLRGETIAAGAAWKRDFAAREATHCKTLATGGLSTDLLIAIRLVREAARVVVLIHFCDHAISRRGLPRAAMSPGVRAWHCHRQRGGRHRGRNSRASQTR